VKVVVGEVYLLLRVVVLDVVLVVLHITNGRIHGVFIDP